MVGSDIRTDIVMIAIMSFFGFCIENVWVFFRHSYVDNRNMYLPFLLGYGLLMNTIYYTIGTPNYIFGNVIQYYGLEYPTNIAIYFILCFLIVTIGELLLGTFIEKVLGYEYWNYSQIPLHITKYTSIPTSFGFALIMTIFMNNFYIPIFSFIKGLIVNVPTIFIIIFGIILLIDFFASFRNMYLNNGSNVIWRFKFNKKGLLIKSVFGIDSN